jgi:hypothetical protein
MTDSFLFNAAAEAAEAESCLAGNPPPALVVDPHGLLPNPEGATPVPDVVVQTSTEMAPEGPASEVAVSAAVPPAAAVAVIPAEGGVGADVLPLGGLTSLRLEDGQQIQVYLDVVDKRGDATSTTAASDDWTHAVTSRDPCLEVVSSALVNGQLVVTLEAGREGVNLTGDVFRVDVKAVADDQSECREQLVIDLNDTLPARDLSSGATIGSNCDPHNNPLIAIEENAHAQLLIDRPTPVGDLVEAFEHQVDAQDHLSADLPLDLSISDPLRDLGHGFAYGHDCQGLEPGGLEDVVVVADPDQLPEDQIEHATDAVGMSFDHRGGLCAVWNRLS